MGLKDVFNVPPVLGDKMQKRLATPVAPLKKQKRLNEREWTFVKELVAGEGAITARKQPFGRGLTRRRPARLQRH